VERDARGIKWIIVLLGTKGVEDWNDDAGWIRTFRTWKGGLVPDWRF
jgi:hypothetical protein